ncbi:MAG: hypothetical protein ACI35Q_06415 [Marinilabiliaceae bacterium]
MEEKKLKPFMKNIIVHLFMVINPLPGHEWSIYNNKTDIVNNWAKPAIMMLRRYKRTMIDIMADLEPEDYSDIVDELKAKHDYKVILVPEGYFKTIYRSFSFEFGCYTIFRKSSIENSVLYDTLDTVIQSVSNSPLQGKVIVR